MMTCSGCAESPGRRALRSGGNREEPEPDQQHACRAQQHTPWCYHSDRFPVWDLPGGAASPWRSLTGGALPGGKYGQILNQDCCTTFALMNANFLPPAGLKANQVFYQDFVRDLLQRQAPVQNIFSYELRNEMFYDSDQPPLSLSAGKITAANGQAYDMSSAADKARMLRLVTLEVDRIFMEVDVSDPGVGARNASPLG